MFKNSTISIMLYYFLFYFKLQGNLKGGCTRFEVKHISCNLLKNLVKKKFNNPQSTLKLAAYIRTSEHWLKSPNIGCYFRVL